MTFVPEPEFWARLGTIVVIDLMLAGDNALVIALAVRSLPKRQQMWGRIWGTAGAIILRLALITLATVVLKVPLLQVTGGALLIWIAIKLLCQDVDADKGVRRGVSLWSAIRIIVIADAVMSLDNVLGVAGAAHGDLRLVVIGIGLSLPLVVWGSGLLARLMNRFAWIIWFGGGALGYVPGEMILDDEVFQGRLDGMEVIQWLPLALAVIITAKDWFLSQKNRGNVPGRAD